MEVRNQLHCLEGSVYSHKVQGIVIEPTNDCNLKCKHCSTPKGKGYMGFPFYKRLIDQDLVCVIIGKNGEPTLHSQITEMVSYAKEKNVYVCIYTNSTGNYEDLIKAGIDEIQFSQAPPLLNYCETKVGMNCVTKEEYKKFIHCANLEPLMGVKSKKRIRPCRNLWRNLVISWNGEVTPCCIDMHNTLVVGDANNESLQDIFNGEKMRHIRKLHLDRKFPKVCKYCDDYFG